MPTPLNPTPIPSRFHCFVLGRAQDGGVPHIGCTKSCCTEARANRHQEFPTSLGIHDTQTDKLLIIEATPAIESQVTLLHKLAGVNEPSCLVDALLLTHAHIGHYAGLLQLGKECASADAIPTYVTKRMCEFLFSNAPWSQLVKNKNIELQTIDPSLHFSPMDGLAIEAIEVPHREDFTDTVAFKIHGPNQTVLFGPDIDRLDDNDSLIEKLFADVDIAYLDGTFYDGRELPNRDASAIPHPLMIDSMNLRHEFAESNPMAIRFIHLNHTNPALNDTTIQKEMRSRGFLLAEQGELVIL